MFAFQLAILFTFLFLVWHIGGQSLEGRVVESETRGFCDHSILVPPNDTSKASIVLVPPVFRDPGDFPRETHNVVVSKLILTVSNKTSEPISGSIHEMITPWFRGMDWDYFPNNTGPVAGVDFVESPVATYNGYTAGDDIEIDITKIMQKWNRNATTRNEGFLIQTNSNAADDFYLCEPVEQQPDLFIFANTSIFDFLANTYQDPFGQFPYPPPYIAYTRFCVFIEGDPIIAFAITTALELGDLLVNGHRVDTRIVSPIPGSILGACITIPPGLNASRIDLNVVSSAIVIIDDLEYTRLLPNEIGCEKFECDNQTVIVNGTMEGGILNASTIVIQNDVIIMGNLTVDGSITLDANSSLLTTQGSLSVNNGIKVLLDDSKTYYDGEEVTRVIATDLENTTVELIGGNTPKSCQELQSDIIPTSEGFAFVVSLNNDPCQVNSASDNDQVNYAVIMSCTAAGIVFIAIIVAVIMYIVRQHKRGRFSIQTIMKTADSSTFDQ